MSPLLSSSETKQQPAWVRRDSFQYLPHLWVALPLPPCDILGVLPTPAFFTAIECREETHSHCIKCNRHARSTSCARTTFYPDNPAWMFISGLGDSPLIPAVPQQTSLDVPPRARGVSPWRRNCTGSRNTHVSTGPQRGRIAVQGGCDIDTRPNSTGGVSITPSQDSTVLVFLILREPTAI